MFEELSFWGEKVVHPTFRVITPKNRKKATVLFVYLYFDKQAYKYTKSTVALQVSRNFPKYQLVV